MNVYGELTKANLENLTADPGGSGNFLAGRLWWRSDTGRVSTHTGSTIYRFLLNDPNIVIGLSATAAQNVRLFRAGTGILQVALGNDATADGSLSATPAQLAMRHDNYATGSLPATGNAGRVVWDSTVLSLKVDDGTNWNVIPTVSSAVESKLNFLYNSNFDIWQRGTSVVITWSASETYSYLADCWYVGNNLGGSGTAGQITYSQVTGTSTGAKYGASVKVTRAPITGPTTGIALYQTLDNFDSLMLLSQTASFSVKILALNNVTQVGIQFMYKTTEAKVDTVIGSEVLTTVNTGAFTTCTISGQALGALMTTSGSVGVRIRVTAVSSGNIYDLNNGFVAEQAIVNLGTVIATWQRMHRSIADEVQSCLRFYQKSYDLTVAPGAVSSTGACAYLTGTTNSNSMRSTVQFKVPMRATPTTTIYDTAGASSKISTSDTAGSLTAGATVAVNTPSISSVVIGISGISCAGYYAQWTADASI